MTVGRLVVSNSGMEGPISLQQNNAPVYLGCLDRALNLFYFVFLPLPSLSLSPLSSPGPASLLLLKTLQSLWTKKEMNKVRLYSEPLLHTGANNDMQSMSSLRALGSDP